MVSPAWQEGLFLHLAASRAMVRPRQPWPASCIAFHTGKTWLLACNGGQLEARRSPLISEEIWLHWGAKSVLTPGAFLAGLVMLPIIGGQGWPQGGRAVPQG